MKKFLLLTLVVVFALESFAQMRADLTIATTGNSNLRIRLNGKRITLKDRSVTFENVNPGNYSLTIFQLQRRNNGITDYVEVYNNTIRLTAGKHTEFTVLRFGKVVWDEGFMNNEDWNDSWNNSSNNGGNQGNGNNQGGNNNNGYNNYVEVTPQMFTSIKLQVEQSMGDHNKLVTARAVMKNKWFTVLQIKEIANLFTSENNKLPFVKNAYENCMEKHLYFSLGEVFTYNSYKQDFMKWLGDR
jgi:hypothetical protein